jgi:excisionase family DNA binding protein
MSSRQLRLQLGPPQPPAPAVLNEPLLTPNDVSVLLGVKRSTIYELTRSGRLPYVKVGRAIRFLRADLESWLDQQRADH